MKKSLVALATLSVVGTAFADVDVSGGIKLYGVLDQAYTSQKLTAPISTSVGPVTYQSMFASSATSRFGFKGLRDLGNGIRGRIQAEIQIEPDNSALIKTSANRTGFVALSKEEAGEIQLGTQETTAYEVFGMDVNGRVEYKPQVWRTTTSSSLQDRANNSIKYVSPTFSGVEFHLQKGLSDVTQSVTGTSAANNSVFTSYGLKFNKDKLKAAIVYDTITSQQASYKFAGIINAGPSNEGSTTVLATGQSATAMVYGGGSSLTNDDKVYRNIASVSYDFGNFSMNYLFAKSFTKGSDSGNLTTNTLGVKVPFENFTIAVSLGEGTLDSYSSSGTGAASVASDGKLKDTTAGIYYAIDKSTSTYLLLSNSTFTGGYSGKTGVNNTYAIGARYNF